MEEHFFEKDFHRKIKSQKSKTRQKYSRLFICGTNAYNPKCRYYKTIEIDEKDRNKKKQTATAPPETVDHIESILSIRVYNAEDQTAALSEVIDEMGQRIFAHNEAVNKSLQ